MTHPKILLLCSLSQNTANGITVRHLFHEWPVDRVALAEFNDGPDEVCVQGIDNYYFLGDKEMRYIAPFHLLRKFGNSKVLRDGCSNGGWRMADGEGQMAKGEGQGAEGRGQRAKGLERKAKASGWKELVVKLQRWYLSKTGLMLVSRKFRISPEFDAWVRDFDPDIIYCVTGDLCKLEFFTRVLKHFDKKGCIHIFDDFLASKHEGTLFPNYWKKRLDQTFREVCDACDLHLAIGDKMADEYSERYGKPFYGFHNPIDPTVWQRAEGGERRAESGELRAEGVEHGAESGERRAESIGQRAEGEEPQALSSTPSARNATELRSFAFLYAGKINKDTIGPIRRFMEAIKRLKGQGQAITFGIHSPYPFEEIERLLGPSAREVYLGKIPYAELPAAYRKADGLLLPLDFTEATIRYIRLSMLTKASEYMISGTPIFCFAPKEIAVTEYLLEHDAALHCGDPEHLDAAILDFIQNAEARKRVARNAVARAQSYHMMGQVNERLRSLLQQAAEGVGRRA